MNVQQEACNLISKMPDESVQFLIELINNMAPAFRTGSQEMPKVDVSQRIGAGKGIITDHPDFDKWDSEVSDLFGSGK